jgi:hypothetical protein
LPYNKLTFCSETADLVLENEETKAVKGLWTLGLEEGDLANDNRWSKIVDWMSAPDAALYQTKIYGERQSSTGLWLLNSPRFEEWKTQAGSTAWLCGKRKSRIMWYNEHANYSSWLWQIIPLVRLEAF